MSSSIRISEIRKAYLGATVLDGIDAEVRSGVLNLLSGPSGSGKTTLLNLVSGLDLPDSGNVMVGEVEVTSLSRKERDRFRARNGQVFQRSGLLGGLTVRDNIEAGHSLTGLKIDQRWVLHLVERLGIADLLDTRASRISGGQAQRTALVRSLAHRPAYLFADEPTASLDTASTHAIHALLGEVAREEGTTILMVSHDEISSHYADFMFHLRDGRLENGDSE